MIEISTNIIKEAVYNLCFEANTCLSEEVYSKLLTSYKNNHNKLLKTILQNAKVAYEKKLPLCQDTGQVIVFLEIGQKIHLTGEFIETAINTAVESCYKDNCFRKSVVKNAIFERINTKTNTPVIIHTKFIEEDEIRINLLVKGAGSENKSKLEMLLPTANEDEIVKSIAENILSAGENSCPPMFVGVGIAGTADMAVILSKKALVSDEIKDKEKQLTEKIQKYVNEKAPEKYKDCFVLNVNLLTDFTHIACMPTAITINCHSDRFSKCTIKNGEIKYDHKVPDFIEFEEEQIDTKEIQAEDIQAIRELKQGEEILLTGEIYVARDMAHKKLIDLISENMPLPLEIENKIIFYAGPCPAKGNEIIGSIGPTTSSRMDKYATVLYNKGLLATIGKGDRSKEVKQVINQTCSKYLTVQGGIAAVLAEKVKKSEIIAFDELGAEAIYKIYVEKFPLKVEIA